MTTGDDGTYTGHIPLPDDGSKFTDPRIRYTDYGPGGPENAGSDAGIDPRHNVPGGGYTDPMDPASSDSPMLAGSAPTPHLPGGAGPDYGPGGPQNAGSDGGIDPHHVGPGGGGIDPIAMGSEWASGGGDSSTFAFEGVGLSGPGGAGSPTIMGGTASPSAGPQVAAQPRDPSTIAGSEDQDLDDLEVQRMTAPGGSTRASTVGMDDGQTEDEPYLGFHAGTSGQPGTLAGGTQETVAGGPRDPSTIAGSEDDDLEDLEVQRLTPPGGTKADVASTHAAGTELPSDDSLSTALGGLPSQSAPPAELAPAHDAPLELAPAHDAPLELAPAHDAALELAPAPELAAPELDTGPASHEPPPDSEDALGDSGLPFP
jgi:hypothetical protein